MRRPFLLVLAALSLGVPVPAAAAPANDAFENAEAITAVPFTTTTDLGAATRQPGEPIDCGYSGLRRTVWYSFTPAAETDLALTASSSGDDLRSIGVYTGTWGALTRLNCHYDRYRDAIVRRTVAAGETIWIQLGTDYDGTPVVTLSASVLYRISGRVTADGTGEPLKGICVRASGTTTSVPQRTAVTGTDGRYTLKLLQATSYRVHFTPCSGGLWKFEYYDNVTTSSAATPVKAGEVPEATGIDASLTPAGRIAGTLTDKRGGPAKFTCVYAYRDSGPFISSATSDASGAFVVGGLTAGTYKLLAGCTSYLPRWYENASSRDDATPIDVVEGADTTLNPLELDSGGVIAGTLTTASGAPVASECVEVYDRPDAPWAFRFGSTDAQGRYRVSGLPTGTYRIRFAGCPWGALAAIGEWYEDASSYETATPVVLTEADTVTADGVLTRGGTISGTVTDEEGFPVPRACVTAYDASSGVPVRTVTADAAGAWTAGRLPEGGYKLRIGCATREFAPKWWPDADDFSSATVSTVADETSLTGRDIVLAFRTGPANDNRSAAVPVTALPYKTEVDLVGATMEPGEPSTCGTAAMRSSVWYALEVAEPRLVRASTIGTVDVDTIITAYAETPDGSLVRLGCANTWAGYTVGETLDVLALPGVRTLVQVATSDRPFSAGLVKLSLT